MAPFILFSKEMMMRLISVFLCLAVLAACGADGAPIRPAKAEAVVPGLTVSGEARLGVATRSFR